MCAELTFERTVSNCNDAHADDALWQLDVECDSLANGLPPLLLLEDELCLPAFEPADAKPCGLKVKSGGKKRGKRAGSGEHLAHKICTSGDQKTALTSATAAAAVVEQNNLGKAYTVELASVSKAARIVRNRAFAKRSLANVKARIAELEAENAALAARDRELDAELDKALRNAAATLQQRLSQLQQPLQQIPVQQIPVQQIPVTVGQSAMLC